MSTLAALRLTVLLLFSGSALAQIAAPDCLIVPWGWTFNSINQNACTIAAYLMSTCNQGSFTINSLLPGYSYTGPSGVDNSNLCKCNTVAYSLISACDACQSSNWITWSEYSFNCSKTLPPSSFPNPVPSGTRVPQWALIDVTLENNWNANKSQATGDSPEIGPGALIGNAGSSGTTGTSGATGTGGIPALTTETGGPTTSPNPAPTGSSSNVGAIAGGVVGGVAAISIAAAAIFFYLRRQHQRAPPATFVVDSASQPPMDEVQQPLSQESSFPPTSSSPPISTSGTGTSVAAMRLYDPNDPTTFPGYQEHAPMPDVSPTRTTFPPYSDGTSLATMHTTRPQATGYHGLPTV